MSNWVTHLMIADGVMKQYTELDRHGFCVGNIAPDCNVENENWTSFTPSRKITHWMSGDSKVMSDAESFYKEYLCKRRNQIQSREQYSFLLGYFAHLITDAAEQAYLTDDHRVKNVWIRIYQNDTLRVSAKGCTEDWNSVKKLISKSERLHEIYSMEGEYLREHPDSGYFTEILPLKEFPDYIDYLPSGCIVRKIGTMGYLPKADEHLTNPIAMSKDEFTAFVNNTISLVVRSFRSKHIINI